ncbi:MAG TPA: hypothetical protein VFB67_08020 [Candidatus Polarisedimenticolaceae bacterium]|nr:hypothetical protein [Candidatus Polarisedimenticolaceae bacterium]
MHMLFLLAIASTSAKSASPDALGYAFKFASAIVADPKDMGKAQEAVVWDYASAGRFDEARAAADRVEGWRRGAAYADLATALAKTGRRDEAAAMVAKAEAFRPTVEGWQNPRIGEHIANAYAALGDSEKAEALAKAVAIEDVQQYAGRSSATIASGRAAKGDFDGAVQALDGLSGSTEIDDAWWRAAGYLDLARSKSLSPDRRRKAIASARTAADAIPGWRKAEALESIADGFRELGMTAEARESVATAESIVAALPETTPIKSPLLSNCARAWAELGRKDAARALLARAEELGLRAQPIDRPMLLSNTASSWAAVGDTRAAKRLYARALAEAEALVNARPRALAVVEICRSIGKSKLGIDDATRTKLDALYAGLKDPW